MSLLATQAGGYPGFHSIKQLGAPAVVPPAT